MSNSSIGSAGRRLTKLLAPAVEQAGVDLEEVEVLAAGKRRLVRVLVDKDGGITLDDVAAVSQAISGALDATPEADSVLGSAAYVLEVSSPGVDRPLVQPRHWRRAIGRLVRASTNGLEFTGRVVATDADGVRLVVIESARSGLAPESEQYLRFDALGPGRVQVEFNRGANFDEVDDAEPDDDQDGAELDAGDDFDAGELDAGELDAGELSDDEALRLAGPRAEESR